MSTKLFDTMSWRSRATEKQSSEPRDSNAKKESGQIVWPDPDGSAAPEITRSATASGETGASTGAFQIDLSDRSPQDPVEGTYIIETMLEDDDLMTSVDLALSTDDDDEPEIVLGTSARLSIDDTGQTTATASLKQSLSSADARNDEEAGPASIGVSTHLQIVQFTESGTLDL